MNRLHGLSSTLICAILLGFSAGSWSFAHNEPRSGDRTQAASPAIQAAAHAPADATLYLHVEGAADIRRELAGRPIEVWFNDAFAAGEAGKVWSQVARAADLDSAALFDALLGRRFTFVVRSQRSAVGDQKPRPRPLAGPGLDLGDNAPGSESRPPASEWALLTEVATNQAEKALAALDPVALGPKSRMAMLELPEHELLLARRGNLLLIGPKENKRLFWHMLSAIGGRAATNEPTLADALHEAVARRAPDEALGANAGRPGPHATLFLRHDPPLGGRSVAIAEFRNNQASSVNDQASGKEQRAVISPDACHLTPETPFLIIRHYGSFDAPPFTRAVTRRSIDCSILEAFDGSAMLAMVEPNDAGRSQLELFLHALIGEGLLSPKMRANLGERRVIVVGEIQRSEGGDQRSEVRGQKSEGSDQRSEVGGQKSEVGAEGLTSDFRLLASVPSIAVCYELKESSGAEEQLDRQMLAFSRRLDRMDDAKVDAPPEKSDAKGAPDVWKSPEAPKTQKFASGRRTLELPAAARMIEGVSLNWTVIDEDSENAGGGWYVIASHPDHLDEVVSTLKRPAFTERDQSGEGDCGQRSEAGGKKSEVRGQRSEVRGQKSDSDADALTPDLRPLTSERGLHSAGVADGPRLAHLLLKLRHAAPLLASEADHRAEMRESLRLLSDLAAGLEHVRWRLTRPSANEIDVEVRIRLAE